MNEIKWMQIGIRIEQATNRADMHNHGLEAVTVVELVHLAGQLCHEAARRAPCGYERALDVIRDVALASRSLKPTNEG